MGCTGRLVSFLKTCFSVFWCLQVWPTLPASGVRVNASATNFTTTSVSLDSGSQYTVSLSARNGAGLLSHAETDGVIVDTVRPTVRNLVIRSSLPLGLQAAAVDENGYTVISNAQSIAVSFEATDSHSGIASSRVGIQNNASGQFIGARGSVGGFVDFGTESSGYLEQLNLQPGDPVNGPFYRVVVQSEDNAGLQSDMLRSALIRCVLRGQNTEISLHTLIGVFCFLSECTPVVADFVIDSISIVMF